MNKNFIIKISALFMAFILAFLCLSGCGKKVTENQVILNELGKSDYVQQAYTEIAQNVRKQETVYVNVAPDGQVQKVSVTDWLHTDRPQVRILDASTLSDIRNVKTLSAPVIENNTLCWDMDTTDLYYSGITDQAPPLGISVKYFINDVETPYNEMAGKSGNVRIEVKVSNNLKTTINSVKEPFTISCPMIMVGGMILSEDKFYNISVQNGTAIGDGTKQIIFFAGMPGIDESLGLSELHLSMLSPQLLTDTYTITADVTDFALGNMMFAAVPFSSLGSLGNGEIPETVDDVKEILSDIQNVQSAFNGLDINKVVSLLYGDTDKLSDMLNAISEAIKLYNENEKLVKTLGSYMTDENLAKLDKLINDLNQTDIQAVSQTLSDPAMQSLMNLLPRLSESLSEVSVLARDLNEVMPILQSMNNDMQDPEIQASLERLPQTLEKLKKLLNVVEENKELLDALGAFADGTNDAQIQSVLDTAEKYINTDNLSEKELQGLAGKMKEWINFGITYDIFTAKPEGAKSSVVFVYKSEAITKKAS